MKREKVIGTVIIINTNNGTKYVPSPIRTKHKVRITGTMSFVAYTIYHKTFFGLTTHLYFYSALKIFKIIKQSPVMRWIDKRTLP